MSSEKLELWKKRLKTNETAFQTELTGMDHREDMYRGKYTLTDMTKRADDQTGEAVKYVYNALAENIEATVSADIPMPKVTARRQQDEHLAVIIENMIRNELNRMPTEEINDQAERTVAIQGGGYYMIEWDNTKRTHGSVGEVAMSFLHPKWVIPQNGVYTSVQDMDYVILKIPQTKEAIKAQYDVDLEDQEESEPEVKSAGDGQKAEDMVTMYAAYYRNEAGGIGKYVWVNDEELEDIEDYQARRMCRCVQCGAAQPEPGDEIFREGEEPFTWQEGDACPACGARDWTDSEAEYEEIPGEQFGVSGSIYVPYYKPDVMPVVLQKNVSVFGRLLGESDADRQEPMQNGLNRIQQKIFDRLLKAGDVITLPEDANLRVDTKDQRVLRVESVADLNMIRHFQFDGNIKQDMDQAEQIYQHMRQTIGVTDSFQGRKDTTATSGTAKQFAAAQAAGRMESKRVMKEAAYAKLFEMIFKWRLAYADEPRPVVYQDGSGDTVYDTFNRWDFLEMDESGEFWWNDQFLFACDPTAPLASNRERLWQETTAQYTSGVFGDPAQDDTRILYWRIMEKYHYPGAGEMRQGVEQKLQQAQQMMQQQAAMAQEQAASRAMGPAAQAVGARSAMQAQQVQAQEIQAQQAQVSPAEIDRMARQAAAQDAGAAM